MSRLFFIFSNNFPCLLILILILYSNISWFSLFSPHKSLFKLFFSSSKPNTTKILLRHLITAIKSNFSSLLFFSFPSPLFFFSSSFFLFSFPNNSFNSSIDFSLLTSKTLFFFVLFFTNFSILISKLLIIARFIQLIISSIFSSFILKTLYVIGSLSKNEGFKPNHENISSNSSLENSFSLFFSINFLLTLSKLFFLFSLYFSLTSFTKSKISSAAKFPK